MPTPVDTVPPYGSKGPGRRSFRISHQWCGNYSSSSTSQPATSPPGSFSTGMAFQRASSDRCSPKKKKKKCFTSYLQKLGIILQFFWMINFFSSWLSSGAVLWTAGHSWGLYKPRERIPAGHHLHCCAKTPPYTPILCRSQWKSKLAPFCRYNKNSKACLYFSANFVLS